jgi:hypothetical protein
MAPDQEHYSAMTRRSRSQSAIYRYSKRRETNYDTQERGTGFIIASTQVCSTRPQPREQNRHVSVKASFVSMGSIPIGMDKYNKKMMIVTIRDPDLFRVEN